MSALDDIRSSADTAHEVLGDADTEVRRAREAAEELSGSASAHGWDGLARAMDEVWDHFTDAESALATAHEGTEGGMTQLAAVTDELSSDEVAALFVVVAERFRTSCAAVGTATGQVTEGRDAAAHADAVALVDQAEVAEDALAEAAAALGSVVTAVEAEEPAARAWGAGGTARGAATPKPIDVPEASRARHSHRTRRGCRGANLHRRIRRGSLRRRSPHLLGGGRRARAPRRHEDAEQPVAQLGRDP
jgi:hypothetical protein